MPKSCQTYVLQTQFLVTEYMMGFTMHDVTDFPINIGLHQGSALSPYLFVLVMDEVTRDIQGEIP